MEEPLVLHGYDSYYVLVGGEMRPTITRLTLERAKDEAEIEWLKNKLEKCEAVAEYAQHYANCQLLESGIGHPMPCTCGLDAARTALEEK